jgi:hypothetical protein
VSQANVTGMSHPSSSHNANSISTTEHLNSTVGSHQKTSEIKETH